MIQVYTGDGKGKTTAALGLAFRAVGHGHKVVMLQFMKGPEQTGEMKAAQKLAPLLTIKPMGRTGFINKDHPDLEDKTLALKALDYAREIMLNQPIDILILDEINVALAFGLLPVEAVIGSDQNETRFPGTGFNRPICRSENIGDGRSGHGNEKPKTLFCPRGAGSGGH